MCASGCSTPLFSSCVTAHEYFDPVVLGMYELGCVVDRVERRSKVQKSCLANSGHSIVCTDKFGLCGTLGIEDSPPPECPHIFGCTANDASTHHLRIPLPSALNTNGSLRVSIRYFIRCASFLRSSWSGALTLVLKNATEVLVSGLSRFVANSVFTTILWNSTLLTCPSFLESSSMINLYEACMLRYRYQVDYFKEVVCLDLLRVCL
jgi:hypothetical protein